MKTRLLRMAERQPSGGRRWIVPNAPHAIRFHPTGTKTMFNGAPSISWPIIRPNGEWRLVTVRVDWHANIARNEIRQLISV